MIVYLCTMLDQLPNHQEKLKGSFHSVVMKGQNRALSPLLTGQMFKHNTERRESKGWGKKYFRVFFFQSKREKEEAFFLRVKAPRRRVIWFGE